MNSESKKFKIGKYVLLLILVVVIQSFLQYTDSVKIIFNQLMGYLKPFIFAIFFAVILQPLSTTLESKLKCSKGLSILGAILIVLIVIAVIIIGIIPGVTSSISQIVERMPEFRGKLLIAMDQKIAFLNSKGITTLTNESLKHSIDKFLAENTDFVKNTLKTVSLNFVSILIMLGQMLIGLIIAIFFISDNKYFESFIHNVFYIFTDREKAEEGVKFLDDSRKIFLNYLWGKFLVSAALGIVVFIFLIIGGVPYAALIAILTVLGNMIPLVGMLFVLTVGTLFVFIEAPEKIWILYVAEIVGNQIEGMVLAPRIVGKTIGLGSFWVITGVLLGGAVLGPVGMVIGVPIVCIVKLIYKKMLDRKISNEIKNSYIE